MNYPQTKQNTQINCHLPHFNTQEVNGILYLTVDLGMQGQQRWKIDGTTAGNIVVTNVNL